MRQRGNRVGRAIRVRAAELMAVATGVAVFLDVVLDIDLPLIPDSQD